MPVSKAAGASAEPGSAQSGDGDAGILELVAAVKPGRGKIEQSGIVLIDQAPALLGRRPVLAGDADRRLDPHGLAFDDRERGARLRGNDRRHRALEDPRLLRRDLGESVAEVLGMVERDRGDHASPAGARYVGGIEPAAQADLEQQRVGRMAREQQEGGGGRDLEHGDRRAGIGALAFLEHGAELLVGGQPSAAGGRRGGSAR